MNSLQIGVSNRPKAGVRRFVRAAALLSFAGIAFWPAAPVLAGQPLAGAIIGGGAGALVGQAIGGRDGAIAGAAIGAAAGAASASRTGGAYGTSVQVGVGYAPPVGVVYPAPAYGGVYGPVYAPAPPLYAPVAPIVVAPPVVYAPPVIAAVPRVSIVGYGGYRGIPARPPRVVYRTGGRPLYAGPVGGHRGNGYSGKHR